jgi:predicted dienelactone hydrolase
MKITASMPWLLASSILLTSAGQAKTDVSVGLREIRSGDLPITLVYPTAEQVQTYTQGAFSLKVAHDAAPLASRQGRRQLIVLSHGSAGSPLPDHHLAATLARAGFVVAQPQHRGDNWQDFSRAGPESWKTRPQDVRETIDAVANDSVLGPLVRTDRVGVHGMSAGGVTALVLAGGQWRMLDLIRHCGRYLDEDIGFCLNGLGQHPMQQQMRRAQFVLSERTPDQFLPATMQAAHGGIVAADPRPDPRIAAVSLLVPVGAIFTAESLARIRIPVGLTQADADTVLLPRFHSQHVLRHCPGCRALSSHTQAGHFDWLAPWPASVAQAVADTQMRGGLPNENFAPAERQSAFDRIAAFFLQSLQNP